jgi:hypothetical protein
MSGPRVSWRKNIRAILRRCFPTAPNGISAQHCYNQARHQRIAARTILSIFDKGNFFKSVVDAQRQFWQPSALGVPFSKRHSYA